MFAEPGQTQNIFLKFLAIIDGLDGSPEWTDGYGAAADEGEVQNPEEFLI